MIQNVRYISGAPEGWSSWLREGDTVTIALEPAGRESVPERSVNSLNLANDLVVRSATGRGRIPLNHIAGIDTGDADPPGGETTAVQDAVLRGHIANGLMRLNALTALPRRSVGWLRVRIDDRSILFDVSDRRWESERLLTPEAERSLERRGEEMLRVCDRSYRWISVKRFRVPEHPDWTSADVVATLIAHPAYWDTYTGGDDIVPNVHGPYRLDAIRVDSYQLVDVSTAAAILDGWLMQYGEVSDEQIEGDIGEVHRLIRDADIRLYLPDLGKEAQHETGWILHSGFVEFVIIGPVDLLALVVASGD